VHPPDDYAQRVEHQPYGKTECWYVLEAERDAHLVLGWNRDTTRGEYLERVQRGGLDELLRRISVKPGDIFYLPAGTMHAIGGGIVLFEVQQASDLTYRIYDYDRTGPDGRKRPLHVEKAADVLNYHRATNGALHGLTYRLDGLKRTALVNDRRFIVERVEANTTAHGIDLDGMPLVVMALEKPVELEARGHSLVLKPYASALLPAALDVVMLSAASDGVPLLTAAPPADGYALERRFGRASVPEAQSAEFFAQFS
jgi:mannose-6-phosphate isomerase